MKFHRLRDTRPEGGLRMSISIQADSAEEADAIFEERWAARQEATVEAAPRLPLITNATLRARFLSPGALEIKRRTPVFR